MIDVLIGLQWGDEGKGKIVDLYAPRYDYVARFQGGPNAGHTLVIDNKKFVLHSIPSGIIHPNTQNIIGTGTVLDPVTLLKEISFLEQESIQVKDRLIISDKAHLILPGHKLLDRLYERQKGDQKIGSTLRGIGLPIKTTMPETVYALVISSIHPLLKNIRFFPSNNLN